MATTPVLNQSGGLFKRILTGALNGLAQEVPQAIEEIGMSPEERIADRETHSRERIANQEMGLHQQQLALEKQRVGFEGQRVGIEQQNADIAKLEGMSRANLYDVQAATGLLEKKKLEFNIAHLPEEQQAEMFSKWSQATQAMAQAGLQPYVQLNADPASQQSFLNDLSSKGEKITDYVFGPGMKPNTIEVFRRDDSKHIKADSARRILKGLGVDLPKDMQDLPVQSFDTLVTSAMQRQVARMHIAAANAAAGIGGNGQPAVSGEEFLKTLDPGEAALVRKIGNYDMDLSKVANFRQRQRLSALVAQAYPGFDMTQYPARLAARKDFTSGKAAANIRSLNTAIGHLDSLSKAAADLDNSPVTLWNYIANKGLSAVGDSRVIKFNNAANAVAGELATIFKNTSGTDQEIKSWREQLSASESPDQLRDGITQLIELMGSRMDALDSQYRQGMSGAPRDFHLLNEKSAGILHRLGATGLLDRDRITEQTAPTAGNGTAPAAGDPFAQFGGQKR